MYASGDSLKLSRSTLHHNRTLANCTGLLAHSLLPLFGGGPRFMRPSSEVANAALQMALLDGTAINIVGSIAHGSSMREFRAPTAAA